MKGERIGQLPGRLRGAHGTGGGLWVHATPCREPALRKRDSGVPWRPLPSLANRSCPTRKNGRPGLDDGQSDVRGRSDAVVSARVAMTLWQGDCGYRYRYRNPAAGGLEVDGSDWVASEAGRGRIGPGVRRLHAFGIRALGTRLRSAIVGHRRKRAPAFRRRAGNKKPPTRRGSVWRPGSELNRRTRICSPLHNHSATRPVSDSS